MKVQHVAVCLMIYCILLGASVFAQDFERMRTGVCIPDEMRVRLDTLSIMPGTFSLQGADTSQYRLDPIAAVLYLTDSVLLGQQLYYQYRAFDLDLSQPRFHKQPSLIEASVPQFQLLPSSSSTFSSLSGDELTTSGFISRGVSVGNNQDVVLNSALNLQISGKLSEDVEILASISDKNVPIQPEGNTEYLSKINNIFLTLLIKSKIRIDAGDIVLTPPKDDFLAVNRNLLGMSLRVNSSWKETTMNNAVGGGVTKGKYVRQTIVPQNGVQGPYRLYGENNETNIVVVAGSERVYLDGVLLVRGQDNDYVIDYNTAEITFTPAILVTTEKRLVVEFECTDRHYTRYNLFTNNEMTIGNKHPLTLRVNFYQEQDLKNQSIQPELTDGHKLFLASLGDEENRAFYPNVDSASFSADRILYVKKDTIVEGVQYEIYEYSLSDSVQLYQVGFTYVGSHKGSYKLRNSTANGRVFAWVAPQDGVPQGDYEPVVLLTTPKLVQMATIAADYHFKPKSFLHTELALSNYDRNTFSKADDKDNVGFAYFLSAQHEQPLKRRGADTSLWSLNTSLQWQFVHKNFHAVERFREVEFARDYNLDEEYSETASEQMLQAAIAMVHPQYSTTKYTLNWLSRMGVTNAIRNELFSHNEWNHLVAHTRTSWLYSTDSVQKSSFVTSQNKLSYSFKKIEVGVSDLLEHNVFRAALTDSMRLNSYAFNEAFAYLKNADSSIYKYNISYKNRLEFAPQHQQLSMASKIHEVNASFAFDRIKNQHFSSRVTYRNQQLRDTLGWGRAENLFVGNVEYSGRFCRNAIILSTYYEMGSGMEQKKTFTYIKVAAGQGTYVWRDYNGNGVEEIDEFEVAVFQDEAEYVKVWLASTDYVNTYNTQFSQSIQLRPAAVWRNKTGFRKFLARFSDVMMLRSQAKQSVPVFNPFPFNQEDTALVSHSFSFNNTFSFNNSGSKFAFDVVVQELRNKELLYYGNEIGKLSMQQVVLKSTPHKSVFLQASYLHQLNRNRSAMMQTRCYTILQHTVSGNIQLQFSNAYFASVNYAWGYKRNLEGEEYVRTHDLKATFNYKMLKRGVLSATLQYVGIRGQVSGESAVAYQLLNGLAVGQNVLWGVDYQCSITDYLQVSLQYEGRKAQGKRSVHTGGLSIKAHF